MNRSHFSLLLAVLVATSINNYNLSISTAAHRHLCAAPIFPPNIIDFSFMKEIYFLSYEHYLQTQLPADRQQLPQKRPLDTVK